MYVGVPAIPICLTADISLVLTALKPKASDCKVRDELDVCPVTTSPALNVPSTFETTIVVCFKVGAAEKEVTLTAVVPSEAYNSKVFVVVFLAV